MDVSETVIILNESKSVKFQEMLKIATLIFYYYYYFKVIFINLHHISC